MNSEGWVSLHKKILGWEWYGDANTFRLFLHLLLKASYKDTNWKGIAILRGQAIASRENLGSALSLTPQQIRTSECKLKSTNNITFQTTNKFTLYTIINYEHYQNNEIDDNKENNGASNKQITNEQQTDNKQITTSNKKINKQDNKKEIEDLFSDQKIEKVFILPEWIDRDTWEGFMEVRKKLGAAQTVRALDLLVGKLEKFKAKGFDILDTLNNSIANSWKDVYEPKMKKAPVTDDERFKELHGRLVK